MTLTRTIAFAIFTVASGLTVAGTSAQAESLEEAQVPAEFPPASFTGKQYVDSRGCVYIRAGIDGLVNWVPRVSRSREVLCGYQPTFAKSSDPAAATETAEAAPAPTVEPARTEAMAAATPPAAPVVATPAVPATVAKAPAPARAVAAAPAPKRKVMRKAQAKKATRKSARHVPAPAPIPAVPGVGRFYVCANPDGSVSNCEMPGRAPQADVILRKPVTVMRNGKKETVLKRVVLRRVAPSAGNAQMPGFDSIQSRTRAVRVVPRHVWEQQQAARVDAPVPPGYRKAWKDDRLNPQRAHQTLDGIYASGLTWTRTVPRRLLKRDNGQDVTDRYPGLKYPYHSYEEMQAAGYDISALDLAPATKRKVLRNSKKARVATKTPTPAKPAAKPAKPVMVTKGQYLQVGSFSDPANARKMAERVKAAGLPARLGTLKRGGKSLRVVLAGPYAPGEAKAALAKAHRAGFRDAFIR